MKTRMVCFLPPFSIDGQEVFWADQVSHTRTYTLNVFSNANGDEHNLLFDNPCL